MKCRKCIWCCGKVTGRIDKVYCSRRCKQKHYRVRNKEHISNLYREWVLKNSEHRKEYMKEYRSTNEYRIMKQRHDARYREKNKEKLNAKSIKRKDKFKAACRAYASKKIKKETCCICRGVDDLELHHSKGYVAESTEGVMQDLKKKYKDRKKQI